MKKIFPDKIIKSKLFLPSIILSFILLAANYFLGTQNVLNAQKYQFRGGICGACQTCMYRMKELACDKYYGFDIYYLILSIFIFSFALGLLSSLYKFNLKKSFLNSILGTIGFIVLVEIIVHFLRIPVLYTEFMEGREWLGYQFLLFNWATRFIPFILLFSAISGLTGILIGKLIKKFL